MVTAKRLIELLETVPPETAILIAGETGYRYYQEDEFKVKTNATYPEWDMSKPSGKRISFKPYPPSVVFDGS